MDHEIIIIGAGASALMLASSLPDRTAVLIDVNPKAGEKIRISGGGKCNITNVDMGSEHYLGQQHLIEEVLKQFDQKALLKWLKKRGLEPVLRKGSQYFCPQSATELLDILLKESRKQRLHLKERVMSVEKRGEYFYVRTNRHTLTGRYVVVASGGLSFPKLGASGIGYEIAASFGHHITKTTPALVGFTVQKEQFFFKALSGTSTPVCIDVEGHKCEGALLFAHKGISGPAVLDASLYWNKGYMEIDFLPNFEPSQMIKSAKKVSTLLPMPKRVSKAFLDELGIEDRPFKSLSKEALSRLLGLKRYRFAPAGTFGYTRAEVTKGGIDTDEIEIDTMESCHQKGLYFIGEVLDVTGRLGGYNFQWAFSSAVVCARAIEKQLRR